MITATTLITPWYRRGAEPVGAGKEQPGAVAVTSILDHDAPGIGTLAARARETAVSPDAVDVLASAHAIISHEVRAVYAMQETTPASRTFARGFGSCSQRLAILESVARAIGVATRVRALLIDRSFWYPRFPHGGFALPDQMVLVWPEFQVQGSWRPASELFGPIGCRGGGAFANHGAETLFEAVGRCAIDWDGQANDDAYDLSRFVRADHGYFANRDEAFARLGQTLCAPARALIDPLFRTIAA